MGQRSGDGATRLVRQRDLGAPSVPGTGAPQGANRIGSGVAEAISIMQNDIGQQLCTHDQTAVVVDQPIFLNLFMK